MYRFSMYLSHAVVIFSCLVADEVSFSIILSMAIVPPRCTTAISCTDSNLAV